jgi:hypothetical protein
MNKKVFKAMWLSVIAVVVVTVSSCSSDSDFFGLDGLEGTIYLNPLTNYQNEKYLDIEKLYFKDFTDNDWNNYIEAESRLSFKYSNDGQCSIIQTSGEEVNISDKLFECIKNSIENSNLLLSNEKSRKIVARSLNRNVEAGLLGNDCVGQCIADYCGLDINNVNQTIASNYPQYINGDGISPDKLLDVVKLFKPDASSQSKFYPNDIFFGEKTIDGIIALTGHTVVIDKIKYYYSANKYHIWAHDPQNSNSNVESDIYKNEIPARIQNGGSIVIFQYIK